MRGQRRLRFLDDDCGGHRFIMVKDGADIGTEAGITTKRAQEQGDNNGEVS